MNADHEELSLSIRLLTLPEQRANKVSNAARTRANEKRIENENNLFELRVVH